MVTCAIKTVLESINTRTNIGTIANGGMWHWRNYARPWWYDDREYQVLWASKHHDTSRFCRNSLFLNNQDITSAWSWLSTYRIYPPKVISNLFCYRSLLSFSSLMIPVPDGCHLYNFSTVNDFLSAQDPLTVVYHWRSSPSIPFMPLSK